MRKSLYCLYIKDPFTRHSSSYWKPSSNSLYSRGATRRLTQNNRPRRNRTRTSSTRQMGGLATQSVLGRQVIDVPFPLLPSVSSRVYEFVQSYEVNNWLTSSNVAATFTANSFTLSSLDQVSSIINMFDEYKMAHIRVTLIPRIEVVDGTTTNAGLFTSVIDLDDAAALTTVGAALDFQNALTSRGSETHVRTFIPHVATAAYTGTFTGFENTVAPWIDTASSTVQHYGMKSAWTQTSAAFTYDAIVSIHLKVRNVR